jgi:hypothetical protein
MIGRAAFSRTPCRFRDFSFSGITLKLNSHDLTYLRVRAAIDEIQANAYQR